MTHKILFDPAQPTNDLLGEILRATKDGGRVMVIVPSGNSIRVITRLRTALSRSRSRNKNRNRKIEHFSLLHQIMPWTNESGKRHECIIMWTEKTKLHVMREHLDDILERS